MGLTPEDPGECKKGAQCAPTHPAYHEGDGMSTEKWEKSGILRFIHKFPGKFMEDCLLKTGYGGGIL